MPGRAHNAYIYGLTCLNLPGKNDLRVPPSQGYEYYHALKVEFISTTFPFQLFHDQHFPFSIIYTYSGTGQNSQDERVR